MKRPNAWRKRDLKDIKKRLAEEETGYVIGKITGEIETPTADKVSSFRRLIETLTRKKQLGKRNPKHKIRWHDDAVIRNRVRRLKRKVRRIEEGKFKRGSQGSEKKS